MQFRVRNFTLMTFGGKLRQSQIQWLPSQCSSLVSVKQRRTRLVARLADLGVTWWNAGSFPDCLMIRPVSHETEIPNDPISWLALKRIVASETSLDLCWTIRRCNPGDNKHREPKQIQLSHCKWVEFSVRNRIFSLSLSLSSIRFEG
jgi:hypothetical protein